MPWFNKGPSEQGSTSDASFPPGTPVVFYNGRRPERGVVEETQDDGRVVVQVKADGGVTRVLKDADEIKAYSDVKNRKARIRFVEKEGPPE